MNAFGITIREARKKRDWTLDRLAKASGVDRQTIHRIEVGTHEGRAETLRRLASALEITFTIGDETAAGEVGK